jgi:hypothetical protein
MRRWRVVFWVFFPLCGFGWGASRPLFPSKSFCSPEIDGKKCRFRKEDRWVGRGIFAKRNRHYRSDIREALGKKITPMGIPKKFSVRSMTVKGSSPRWRGASFGSEP